MEQTTEKNATSFDDALDALVHVERRKLLISLLDHNPQNDRPAVNVDLDEDADSMERLIQMKHVHLPKLVDMGLIEWSQESHEVAKGPKFDEIRPLLELLHDHEDELPDGWL